MAWGRNAKFGEFGDSVEPSNYLEQSFQAIQRQQQLEQLRSPSKSAKSLREIQRQEEDLRREEEFLRWWASEEDKVRREESDREHLRTESGGKQSVMRGMGRGRGGRGIRHDRGRA